MGKKPKKPLTVNTTPSSPLNPNTKPLPSPSTPHQQHQQPHQQQNQQKQHQEPSSSNINDEKQKKSSPSPSSSLSPKMIFISGIVLGLVVAAAAVSYFLQRNLPPPQMTIADVQHIEQLRTQGKSVNGLFEAIAFYEQAIANVPKVAKGSREFASLLDEAGDAFHSAKKYDMAEKYHRRSMEIKMKHWSTSSSNSNEVIFSYVALATDLFKAGKFDQAFDYVHRAQAFRNLPPNVQSMLFRLEAIIHECNGDFVSALHRFEHALTLAPSNSFPQEKQIEFLHVHRDLLRKTRSYNKMPDNVAKSMEEKEKRIDKQLLAIGPWVNPLQLPKVYLPNLTSKSWHDINDYPQLRQAYDLVMNAHESLKAEYLQLLNKSLLIQEGECINDIHKGKWAVHDITSFWVPRDESGCSIAAPAGCNLFRKLKSIDFPVIRGGYSAIAPGAWLRPHFGVTNGQLKFHLGIIVPKLNGERCAFMRVGNEIRGWEEGEITFFDDSYEHEVWNNCTLERIVFQVVFVHPDLPANASHEKLFSLPSH